MQFRECLSFDDVLISPQYSGIESRKEVDISSILDEKRGYRLNLPIIASPMDTISETEMVVAMAEAGGLAIVHRFNTIKKQCEILNLAKVRLLAHKERKLLTAAAIGVSDDDYKERADTLVKNTLVDILCVDVAHGHHVLVERTIKYLKDTHPHIHIMAGNIATHEGCRDLTMWGADSIRIGIGGGSACETRTRTASGMPTLQSILDCHLINNLKVPLIADGGIRNSGDIVKSLAAGANFVMCGSLLSATEQTPGDIVHVNGNSFKAYKGMASKSTQIEWRGYYSSNEGVATMVPYKGSVYEILSDLKLGITSGLSYSGCNNIEDFQDKAVFIRQTQSGLRESHPHILTTNVK